MASYKTLSDVKRYIEQIPTFAHHGREAAKLGCETIRHFLEKIGSPHLQYPTLHVAGTNGKGTTCRLLASALWGCGLKVGINTSPHLISYHERIQIGDQRITDDELLQFFKQYGDLPEFKELTYFELMTSLAFWYFAKQMVDIAIIETGLGGRLDATNVVNPICTAITSISLDHTDLLGDTIEQIAREKGGICKPGIPLVIGQLPLKARMELEKIAHEKHADFILSHEPITNVQSESDESKWMKRMAEHTEISFTDVEKLNLPIVLRCLNEIQSDFSDQITEESILNGFKNREKLFPLRATFVRLTDSKRWFYDGAHNVESLEFLFTQLKNVAPLSEWTLVCGFMKDKLRPEIAPILAQIESRYFVPIHSSRAVTYTEFIEWWNSSWSGANGEVSDERSEIDQIPSPPLLIEDFNEAKRRFSDELVIFTGSFYFYEALMMSE